MWISKKEYNKPVMENICLKENDSDASKYRSIVGLMTRYDGLKDTVIRDVECCIMGREFYDSLIKEMNQLRFDLQEAHDVKNYYFNKYMEQKGHGEEKKQITPWDIVKLLSQLKERNPEQTVIIELPGNGATVKLKDVHNIYEGCCGEIVLDAE